MEIVRYRILKKGRKWFEGEVPGKGWKAKILVNSVSKDFKVGEVITFPAEVKVRKGVFGARVEVFPKSWEEVKNEVGRKIQESFPQVVKRVERLLSQLPEEVRKDIEALVEGKKKEAEKEEILRRMRLTLLRVKGRADLEKMRREVSGILREAKKVRGMIEEKEKLLKTWSEEMFRRFEKELNRASSLRDLFAVRKSYVIPLNKEGLKEVAEKANEAFKKRVKEVGEKSLSSLPPKEFYYWLEKLEGFTGEEGLNEKSIIETRNKIEDKWDSEDYELMNELSQHLFGKSYEEVEDKYLVKGMMTYLRKNGIHPGEFKLVPEDQREVLEPQREKLGIKVIPLNFLEIAKYAESRRRKLSYSDTIDYETLKKTIGRLYSLLGEEKPVWLVSKKVDLLPAIEEGRKWKEVIYAHLKEREPDEVVKSPFPKVWSKPYEEYVAVLKKDLTREHVSQHGDWGEFLVAESRIKNGDVVVVRDKSEGRIYHRFYRKILDNHYGHLFSVEASTWKEAEKALFNLYQNLKEGKDLTTKKKEEFSLAKLKL
jgi:hypothetical protein